MKKNGVNLSGSFEPITDESHHVMKDHDSDPFGDDPFSDYYPMPKHKVAFFAIIATVLLAMVGMFIFEFVFNAPDWVLSAVCALALIDIMKIFTINDRGLVEYPAGLIRMIYRSMKGKL